MRVHALLLTAPGIPFTERDDDVLEERMSSISFIAIAKLDTYKRVVDKTVWHGFFYLSALFLSPVSCLREALRQS